VAFLGIDGSGKSTFSTETAKSLSLSGRTCLISDTMKFFDQGEEANLQPLLSERVRRGISNLSKTAASLAAYKLPKLAELLLRDHLVTEAARWYTPSVIVLDGSPLLNLLAWASLYKDQPFDDETCSRAIGILSGRRPAPPHDPIFRQYPELDHLRRLGLAKMCLPDVVVYIEVSAGEACHRIALRGQPRQVHETEEMLGRLSNAYRQVCRVATECWRLPVAIVNGEQAREAVGAEALEFVRKQMENKDTPRELPH
jgi:thymidylate kinase